MSNINHLVSLHIEEGIMKSLHPGVLGSVKSGLDKRNFKGIKQVSDKPASKISSLFRNINQGLLKATSKIRR